MTSSQKGTRPGYRIVPGQLPPKAHTPLFCALCGQTHEEPVYDHIERHSNLIWLSTAARHLMASTHGQAADSYHVRMANRLMAQMARTLMRLVPAPYQHLLSSVLLAWEAAVGL